MYLGEAEARELHRLGFKITFYIDEVAPFDFYQYQNQEWCVGGRILPDEYLASPSEIYEEGIWLPSINDLMFWLEAHEYKFLLSCNLDGLAYRLEVFDSDKVRILKTKGASPVFALFHAVKKLLSKGHAL